MRFRLLKGGHIGFRQYLARAFLAIITTLAVLGDVSGLYTFPYIDQIEDILYDTRVRLTAPGGVDDRIVVRHANPTTWPQLALKARQYGRANAVLDAPAAILLFIPI